MEYNRDQRDVINAAKRWYKNPSEQVFQFSGGPGTGKSVVLHAIIQELGIDYTKVAPMAYTGAAALVMRLKGFPNAKTIHSWLYAPVEMDALDKDGKPIMDTYYNRPKKVIRFVPKPLGDIKIIVIDEASMVPYNIKAELESRGVKILCCFDLDQLPPVMDKPAYEVDNRTMFLREIMRQAENSAIVYLSHRLINEQPIHKGFYGDVLVIEEDEVTNQMLLGSNIILCGKNATKEYLNYHIRHDLLHIDSPIPVYGDKVICRKNNWMIEEDGINLVNGLTGYVCNNPDIGSFDGKNFVIDFQPYLSNTPFYDIKCDYQYFVAPTEKKKFLKNNKYNNNEKFDFSYCITTHLSQGSQYANGMYFEEYLNRDINKNLNFTGITRFSNSCIYVKRKIKKYY